MKKILSYILICAWLFSALDWGVIVMTRFVYPDSKDWMHAHEKQYSAVTFAAEYFICAPAIPLKPIIMEAMKHTTIGSEQQSWITHSPDMSFYGFYKPFERGKPYTFIPWWSWFAYWFPQCLIWYKIARRFNAFGRFFCHFL